MSVQDQSHLSNETHLIAKHPFPAAGLLGISTLPIHVILPHDWSVLLAAFILAMIAGVYIGFGVLDGRLGRLVLVTAAWIEGLKSPNSCHPHLHIAALQRASALKTATGSS